MTEGAARSYRDLRVWQKAMDFATEVYRLTKAMPRSEEFRLTSQVLRAAASVPANIAEGNTRASRKEYAHFVSIARGSLAEAETLIMLAVRADLLNPESVSGVLAMADALSRQLNTLRQRLVSPPTPRSLNPSSPIPHP